MLGQSNVRLRRLPSRPIFPVTVAKIRKPVAGVLLLLLILQWTIPALAQQAPGAGRTGGAAPKSSQGKTPAAPVKPAVPPGGGGQEAAASSGGSLHDGGAGAGLAVSLQAFQNDLFTGAASAELPIAVPPGTAGVAPKVVLRYNSGNVDDLRAKAENGLPPDQGPWTGLGWTLDVGGYIARDAKGTVDTGDDTFRLLFNGASHELVLIDAGQHLYHTKDEAFWRLQYDPGSDAWSLWTKDGTRHRFGFTPARNSKATTYHADLQHTYTYKYALDEVATPSGTAVQYTYYRQQATSQSGRVYDQALYPDTIRYTYANDSPVGNLREVRFVRDPQLRTDYTDTTATTDFSYFEKSKLGAIEVLVGTSLVRKYALTYDYSIDRDPGYTWGGGATGDLTLLSVTQIGTDGTSALPPVTFTYSAARLASANNGLGGTVSYTYERVSTLPLRWAFTDYYCYYLNFALSG